MSSSESTQKIILAIVAAAGVLLLGPYLGISIFSRGVNDNLSTTQEADGEEAPRPMAHSAELELPSTNSAETGKPSTGRSNQESSDLEDLLKSR